LIECNTVIPKIITINAGENSESVIVHYGDLLHIQKSHRIVVVPEKEELTVEQIHLMQKDIQVAFSQMVLVALIDVDASSVEVQNSLLKCLEEDSERIQFLFIIHNSLRLLPTILSRCSLEDFRKISSKRVNDAISLDFISFQNNSDTKKEDSIKKIDQLLESSPSIIKDQKTLRYVLQMRNLIVDNNMNPVSALDAILIFLSKTATIKGAHE